MRVLPPCSRERRLPDPANPQPEHDRLVRKLESIAELSAEDERAVRSLPLAIKTLPADTDIVREGERPSQSCLVVDGFACRYKLTPAGRRQIMSFHIPGDVPDVQSLLLRTMDHSLGTLTPCRLAFVTHESLRDLIRQRPRIADAFWRDTLIDAAVFREWMVGIGRRSARQRIAHLLCELLVRLEAVGLTEDHAYELPVTQEELGDALGLSSVHVNRVLQELRQNGLVVLRGRRLSTPDWEGLKAAGEFDPTYLHLDHKEAAA